MKPFLEIDDDGIITRVGADDGCALDFTQDPDDDQTAELRALFPDGDPSDRWQDVFGA